MLGAVLLSKESLFPLGLATPYPSLDASHMHRKRRNWATETSCGASSLSLISTPPYLAIFFDLASVISPAGSLTFCSVILKSGFSGWFVLEGIVVLGDTPSLLAWEGNVGDSVSDVRWFVE